MELLVALGQGEVAAGMLPFPGHACGGLVVWEVRQEGAREDGELPSDVAQVDEILDFVFAVAGELLLEEWEEGGPREDDVGFVPVGEEARDVAYLVLAKPLAVVRRAVAVLVVPIEDVAVLLDDAVLELREGRRHELRLAVALSHAVVGAGVARGRRRRAVGLHFPGKGRDDHGALGIAEQPRIRLGDDVEPPQQRRIRPEVDVAQQEVRRLDAGDGHVSQFVHRVRRVLPKYIRRRREDHVVGAVVALLLLPNDVRRLRVDRDDDRTEPTPTNELHHPQPLRRRLRREGKVDRTARADPRLPSPETRRRLAPVPVDRPKSRRRRFWTDHLLRLLQRRGVPPREEVAARIHHPFLRQRRRRRKQRLVLR
mmetsp:Transcript_5564/g.18221  ORF Transcript_5564/g.18221 Transcript_5564/m.18221 type:complete len:369 (-) Transcript_5564:24-1130(-)